MLTRETLNAATGIVEVLDARYIALVAVPDTPLAALVSATRCNPLQDHPGSATTVAYTPDLDFIQDVANVQDPETGSNQHDQTINDIAAVVIPAVRNHLLHARTIVNPLVEELGQRVGARMKELTPTSLSGAEICIREVPAPYGNSSLESLIARFKGTAFQSPPLLMRLPNLDDMSVARAMFQTGTASLDGDIEQWLAACGDSFIQEVWGGVFQVNEAALGQDIRKNFSDWINDPECGMDYALAIFLLSRHLIDNIPDGTEMDFRTYENLCADYRDQAASAIDRVIEREEQAVKNDVLVASRDRLCVEVNGEVYRKWIEAGGENEVLFGNALQSTPSVTVAAIDANAQAYRKAWDQHTGLVSTVERNKRFNTVIGLFEQYFSEQISHGEATEFAQAGGLEQIQRRFREELRCVTERDLDNLYVLALRLVCKARFPEHAAFDILSGINRNAAANPQLDVRECAMLSTFEYVAEFICSQIKILKR